MASTSGDQDEQSGGGRAMRRTLYVGNLSKAATEETLSEVFGIAGGVKQVKLVNERPGVEQGYNYGFVEYEDPRSAESAMRMLSGRRFNGVEMKIGWANQNQIPPSGGTEAHRAPPMYARPPKELPRPDTTNGHHLFVGDLSAEVDDEMLRSVFAAVGESLFEARVMWDMSSLRSRGYGFVSYRELRDAEQALTTMDGAWVGSRRVRVSRANTLPGRIRPTGGVPARLGITRPPSNVPVPSEAFEQVSAQSVPSNTTVYVGNLPPTVLQNDLAMLFDGFGCVVEAKLVAERGYAFVKLDTHEAAALAICQLQGSRVQGRPVRISWGRGHGAPPSGLEYYPSSPEAATAATAVAALYPPHMPLADPSQTAMYGVGLVPLGHHVDPSWTTSWHSV